jgi:hypothetical protein
MYAAICATIRQMKSHSRIPRFEAGTPRPIRLVRPLGYVRLRAGWRHLVIRVDVLQEVDVLHGVELDEVVFSRRPRAVHLAQV